MEEVTPEMRERAHAAWKRIDQTIEGFRLETAGSVQTWRKHFHTIRTTIRDYADQIELIRGRLPEGIILNDLSTEQQNEVLVLQHFYVAELEALQAFGRSSKAVHEQIDGLLESHRGYLKPFREYEEKFGTGVEIFQKRARILDQSQREVEEFRASLIQQGRDMFMG